MNNPLNQSIDDHPIIAKKKHLPLADKAADIMTEGMGSWRFLFFFSGVIVVWICLNLYGWWKHWDPYPFILLNLALSTIAAFQAPIIMMSQNRQADRDRIAAKYDYAVNRKAEREIQNMQKDLDEIKELIKTMNSVNSKKD